MDDAVKTGTINFQNKAMYDRICSAHKTLDYRNMEELANHRVWLPFHFLPGNDGKLPDQNPDQHFVKRVVCTKDSPVAQDMVAACIRDRHKPYGLHRLGITLHTYADTWAHQGFAGINNEINDIRDLGYAYGEPGNRMERKRVDLKFQSDLITKAKMKEWMAAALYEGVRVGGEEVFGLSFSWAFARKPETR